MINGVLVGLDLTPQGTGLYHAHIREFTYACEITS